MLFSHHRIWFYILLALISTIVASDTESVDVAHNLYDEAIQLLADIPQFATSNRYSTESKLMLNVPRDYSTEKHVQQNQELLQNLPVSQKLAYSLLEQSSELGDVDASYLLAEINMFGNYSYPTNGSTALHFYKKVVEQEANATAFFNIAFIYSTGLFGEVEIDQLKANLYYEFAFRQGDLRAGMVLGTRYANAIAVEYDCKAAVYYYQTVADALHEIYQKAPIGGPHLDSYSIRISDFSGGVYGKGVESMGSSLTRKSDRYDHILSGSYSGNTEPIFDSLYWMIINHYEGSYLKKRDFKAAFSDARYVMDHALLKTKELIDVDRKYAAKCIHILGKMYMRGEGVEQNYEQALSHFKKALEFHSLAEIYNDMGMIYEFGPESIRDLKLAGEYYGKSRTANGVYNFGRWLINSGNMTGIEFIELASRHRNTESLYFLNELSAGNQAAICEKSLDILRHYVEKFDKFITSLEWSFFELVNNRSNNALIGYAMAAEQGFETAQSSAASLLYRLPNLAEEKSPYTTKERRNMALVYLTRASKNFNVETACVLGDVYCEMAEYEKASNAYELAARKGSSQAQFNLGWMHEMGFGFEKDYSIARGHYELALSYNPKSYIVIKLALLKLRMKSFINDITGGGIKSIDEEFRAEKEEKELSSGWSAWLDLYRKIRRTGGNTDDDGQSNPSDNINDQNPSTVRNDDEDDNIQYEEIVVVGLFMFAIFSFVLVHFINQRQIRRRQQENQGVVEGQANNNRDGNGLNFQFDFRVIAI